MEVSSQNSFLLTHACWNGSLHDLLVIEGKIAACLPRDTVDGVSPISVPSDVSLVHAKEQLLFPSFIDAHVHLREPGFEYKEDIASGLAAAAYGGFGAVLAMANTFPVNDSGTITRFMIDQAERYWPHGPRLYPVGALTMGLQGKDLAPFGELQAAGCVAFSNDGLPITNTELFRRAMEYAAQWGAIVIDHCEDPFLAHNTHMNEGYVSGKIGLKGQSTVAEALQVARDILLAEYLNLPVHLAHISCRQSLDLIAAAKDKGIPVTAETCPHYLLLDDSSVEQYNTAAKVNPPLRTQDDIQALRKAVRDGTIDILVTDHAPHAPHEKEQPFDEAPNGLIGLETAVPLTYGLVRQQALPLHRFIELWHEKPAHIFNLPLQTFAPDNRADFFLFDPDREWRLGPDTSHSKSSNSPFWGQTLFGQVTAHFQKGVQILETTRAER